MSRIGIIGGGCSGVLCALVVPKKDEITIFEKDPVCGKGVAYSTPDPLHLLNVPSARMSAYADNPGHFSDWIANKHPELKTKTFVPRLIYGEYLSDTLSTEREGVRCVNEEVVSVSEGNQGIEVITNRNNTFAFDNLILALGIPRAVWPVKVQKHELAFEDPWAPNIIEKLLKTKSIALLGYGLTTVDLMISLISRGYQGEINILSRHGLSPNAHFEEQAQDVTFDQSRRTLKEVYSWIKENIKNHRWDKVIDSLRANGSKPWTTSSEKDRKTFLRHLKSFWEIHRHRMAPEVGELISSYKEQGKFKVFAGRYASWDPVSARLEFRPRGSDLLNKISAEAFVNCTGFAPLKNETAPILIQSLAAAGFIKLDSSGLGIDPTSRVLLDSRSRVKVIGALRRAELFETTAVPTLVHQAKEIVSNLACSA